MAKENIRERTHENVDKIIDKGESMRESGSEKIAHVKKKAKMMKETFEGYIRKNPKKSVLIAAGIGAAVAGGALFAATKMRKKELEHGH